MRHRILVLLTLLAAGGALTLPAAADAASTRPAVRPLGFGIAPAATTRAYFILHAARGSLVSGRLRVFNVTSRRLTAVLRPADAATAATGGVDFGTRSPTGDGAWLSLSKRLVRLEPFARTEIAFAARIPADAIAGDHFAGITAYRRGALDRLRRRPRSRRGGPFTIRTITRLAVAIQFKVPGPAPPALRAGKPAISAQPAGTSVVLPVRNSGRRMIPATSGHLTLSLDSRVLSSVPVRLTTFIPRTQIEIRLPLTGQPVEGTYRLRGVLAPRNAAAVKIDASVSLGSAESSAVQRATGHAALPGTAIPAWMIAVVAVSILTALVACAALLRSRRR